MSPHSEHLAPAFVLDAPLKCDACMYRNALRVCLNTDGGCSTSTRLRARQHFARLRPDFAQLPERARLKFFIAAGRWCTDDETMRDHLAPPWRRVHRVRTLFQKRSTCAAEPCHARGRANGGRRHIGQGGARGSPEAQVQCSKRCAGTRAVEVSRRSARSRRR